jgi:hypothetical protein
MNQRERWIRVALKMEPFPHFAGRLVYLPAWSHAATEWGQIEC